MSFSRSCLAQFPFSFSTFDPLLARTPNENEIERLVEKCRENCCAKTKAREISFSFPFCTFRSRLSSPPFLKDLEKLNYYYSNLVSISCFEEYFILKIRGIGWKDVYFTPSFFLKFNCSRRNPNPVEDDEER